MRQELTAPDAGWLAGRLADRRACRRRVVVAAVSLAAIARVEWPAFNSLQPAARAHHGGPVRLSRRPFRGGLALASRRRTAGRQAALRAFLSALAMVTLAMPLGATKLYLFGVSVDQQFRTEYLTRLADTAGRTT